MINVQTGLLLDLSKCMEGNLFFQNQSEVNDLRIINLTMEMIVVSIPCLTILCHG